MCGIIGVFGRENSIKLVKDGIRVLQNRGKDGNGFYEGKNHALGHCLHSIVGRVKQPLEDNEVFISNCEIYNWEELNEKYRLNARNDSEMLFKLLKNKGVSQETLNELDGVYAFAFLSDNKLWIARDIIGIKPVWYSHSDGFYFASEKKALEKLGIIDINELIPRKIIGYDLEKDSVKFIERKFFDVEPEIKDSLEIVAKKVELKVKEAIAKRVPKRKFGILFSGGIDSTVLALVMKNLKQDFTCYTSVLEDPNLKEPQDLTYAKKIAKDLGLKLKIVKIKISDVEKYLKKIVPLIEDSNVVKAGVALTFYAACEQAQKDECKVLFSGLGSEEIFAGYQRHKESTNINKECVSGMLKMYERDLYRDDVVTMYNQIELRVPFLDKKLVEYSLRIPEKFKLVDGHEKFILRVAAQNMGLKDDYALRKKKAAQYGSNFHKAIEKLKKQNGFKTKSEYLRTFYPSHNVKLGALISSGKDSIFAAYTMWRQNYDITCLITLKSENPDSYMFHTPAIDMADLQAVSMNKPLIIQKTKGEKEKELEDLKEALKKAKEKHGIQGVVTGALYSTYQRDRIEKICDSLSLKIFSPLWHINQETEMREIINNNFEFILTSVAADGLDKSWLGRIITEEDVDALVKLNERIGINIAFEGGEAESLVLDCPMFEKKLIIKKSEKVMENKYTGRLKIINAELE
ncbi:diphthine--ammonia ligase, partial [Bacteroidota bacterium]